MLSYTGQRLLSIVLTSTRKRAKTVALQSRSPYLLCSFHTTVNLRDADPAAAEPAAPDDTPPPIVWTTNRLSTDQISRVDAIFHKVLWLDVFETHMLIELINHRLGITMSPKQRRALEKQMDARASGGSMSSEKSAEETEAVQEAPKTFDLKLTGFDAKAKIKVIKEVRAIAGLGLKEAKELVESAPKTIQSGLKPEEAEALKAKLEEIGATIDLV